MHARTRAPAPRVRARAYTHTYTHARARARARTHTRTHTHTHTHTHLQANQGTAKALITGFATGTVNVPAVVCVWACSKGKCGGSEQRKDDWELVWKGVLQPKKKTEMRLEKPLLLKGGQERGFLMHSPTDRVCYSEKQQGAEDGVVCIKPWFATSSDAPFGKHQQGEFKYTHAGSISYTTHSDDVKKKSAAPRAAPFSKTCGSPSSVSRLRAPPGHGAEKDAHKCEICNLYFTSAQALGGHRATSQEHHDHLARIEGREVVREGHKDKHRDRDRPSARGSGDADAAMPRKKAKKLSAGAADGPRRFQAGAFTGQFGGGQFGGGGLLMNASFVPQVASLGNAGASALHGLSGPTGGSAPVVWQSRAARSLAAAVPAPAEEATDMPSGDSLHSLPGPSLASLSTRPVVGSLLPSTTERFRMSFPSAMSVPGLAFSAFSLPFGAGIGSSGSVSTSYGSAGIASSHSLAAAAKNGGNAGLPTVIASSCGGGERGQSKDKGKTRTES